MTLRDTEEQESETREKTRDLTKSLTRPVHVVVGPATPHDNKELAEVAPLTLRQRQKARNCTRKRIAMVVILAAIGVAGFAYRKPISARVNSYLTPKNAMSLANIQTFTAKRGDLRITMVEEGKLRAVNNSTIRMGVSGKITWLAEAGSKVKKGDKLAVIDTKQYEDSKKTMEGQLNSQQQLLDTAETQVPIAEADGQAAVKNAKNLLKTAELALKQYISIDVPKKVNDLDAATNDARVKLSDQRKKRADIQAQVDSTLNEDDKAKFLNDLAVAKQTESSMLRAVTNAEDGRKLFRAHSYQQDLGTKQRAVENARLDVIKAEVKAKNDLLAKKSDVLRLKTSVDQLQRQIKSYEDAISRGTATSPTDGLVYYGGPDLERYGLSADQIKVGADWYSNQPLMSIPDLSAFQVAVPIAEVYRGRVSNGIPATVLIDAVPGLILAGQLASVSSVSRPKFAQDSASPPVYDAVLSLAIADPRMVAGMTVRVEIVTGTLSDVMQVPVEGVFNEEGKTAAFVWIPGKEAEEGHVEKRPVLTGQSNDHFVEIKKGLNEGDKLLLSRPASFVTPTDYREQVEAMFPPTTAPAPMPFAAPTTAPSDGRRPNIALPTSNPSIGRRGGRAMTAADAAAIAAGQPAPTSRPTTRPVIN